MLPVFRRMGLAQRDRGRADGYLSPLDGGRRACQPDWLAVFGAACGAGGKWTADGFADCGPAWGGFAVAAIRAGVASDAAMKKGAQTNVRRPGSNRNL